MPCLYKAAKNATIFLMVSGIPDTTICYFHLYNHDCRLKLMIIIIKDENEWIL